MFLSFDRKQSLKIFFLAYILILTTGSIIKSEDKAVRSVNVNLNSADDNNSAQNASIIELAKRYVYSLNLLDDQEDWVKVYSPSIGNLSIIIDNQYYSSSDLIYALYSDESASANSLVRDYDDNLIVGSLFSGQTIDISNIPINKGWYWILISTSSRSKEEDSYYNFEVYHYLQGPQITLNVDRISDDNGIKKIIFSPGEVIRIILNGYNVGESTEVVPVLNILDNNGSVVYDSYIMGENQRQILGTDDTDLFVFEWVIPYSIEPGIYYFSASIRDGNDFDKVYDTLGEGCCEKTFDTILGFEVQIVPPDVPIVFSPPDGITLQESQPIVLRWEIVNGAEYYEIIFGQSCGSGNIIAVEQNKYTMTTLEEGYYYWAVRAINSSGLSSDWSNCSGFRITTPLDPPVVLSCDSIYISEGKVVVPISLDNSNLEILFGDFSITPVPFNCLTLFDVEKGDRLSEVFVFNSDSSEGQLTISFSGPDSTGSGEILKIRYNIDSRIVTMTVSYFY